mmetsp:Transcript_162972/g.300854  ORF Transcript_162972/g.300854 Transcript_162972/m.300854 type:complete len:236 (+) Transcript_162972:1372-2079(+)
MQPTTALTQLRSAQISDLSGRAAVIVASLRQIPCQRAPKEILATVASLGRSSCPCQTLYLASIPSLAVASLMKPVICEPTMLGSVLEGRYDTLLWQTEASWTTPLAGQALEISRRSRTWSLPACCDSWTRHWSAQAQPALAHHVACHPREAKCCGTRSCWQAHGCLLAGYLRQRSSACTRRRPPLRARRAESACSLPLLQVSLTVPKSERIAPTSEPQVAYPQRRLWALQSRPQW